MGAFSLTSFGREAEAKLNAPSMINDELSLVSRSPRVLLIVCPLFPPVSAADMHRVRISLPFYESCGWRPIVLAVDPACIPLVQDPLLLKSIPPDIDIHYASAIPEWMTRVFGFGDVGIRAMTSLHRTGARIIREQKVDLVFFSTTVFTSMILGRAWKKKLGVPFVLDIQDMWASDYYDDKPASERPPKYRVARRIHKALESWTMKDVDGLMAVSEDYLSTLAERYPGLEQIPQVTLPLGVSLKDYELIEQGEAANSFFAHNDGNIHGVYVGRGGKDMAPALRIFFGALRRGLQQQPRVFSRVHLYFIGTSYATDARAQQSIMPVAREFGVQDRTHEFPLRIPYFSALRMLLAADFLVVPGSDDPEYSPSKIYPYIPAKKPMLCVIHEKSNVVQRLQKLKAASVVTFGDGTSVEGKATELHFVWEHLLRRMPFEPPTDWAELNPFTAEALTHEQCRFFDAALERSLPRPAARDFQPAY